VANSIEVLYHFTCQSCEGWWSIAFENFVGINRKWYCPWCGVEQHYVEGDFPVGREVSPEKDN